MDTRSATHRVPVVVFDDGSLTRAGLERVARYASGADLLGGVRGPALAGLLGEFGVPVRDLGQPDADLAAAAELAGSRSAVLVSGAPLNPGLWISDLEQAAQGNGRCGLATHIPEAGNTGSVRVAVLTPPAASWAQPLGAAFGTVAALHAEVPAGAAASGAAGGAAAGRLLESPGADLLLLYAAVPYPEPAAGPADTGPEAGPAEPKYAVTAADTVLAVLTDTALQLTNRSPVRVRVRTRLGAAGDSTRDLGAVEADLAPRETGTYALADIRFLAGLEPPRGVVRHWSHETETVYDGGAIRINGLDIRFLDAAGETISVGSYGSRQGLHVGVNAPGLLKALGSALTSVAGAYERMASRRGAAFADLLDALSAPRERPSPAQASQPD